MDSEKASAKGVKIKVLNWIFLLVEFGLSLLVLFSFISVNTKYNNLFYTVNDFTESNKAVIEFRNASDFLTDQARLFAINEDSSFLDSYLKELNSTCRREQALEILELSHDGDEPDVNLKHALEDSNKIVQNELYAAKLVWTSLSVDVSTQPDTLQAISIRPEDKNLSPKERIKKAQDILFGSSYIDSKAVINKHISSALTALVNASLNEQKEKGEVISHLFFVFRLSLSLLFGIFIIYIFVIIFLVLRPIHSHISKIESGEKMNVEGSFETRYIANAYNALLDKNEIKASILKHKAEHDCLTGLINRGAFDQIKKIIAESTESVAYLIIDIDFFKQINDNHGHQTGDLVLRKIAGLLTEQFRNTDYVARIGGDEFAILMTKIGDHPESVIQRKIVNLNSILQNVHDGLPSVSLSVGVSISDNGYNEELEKQSDEALYRVKKGGRCNCSFFKY